MQRIDWGENERMTPMKSFPGLLNIPDRREMRLQLKEKYGN